MCSGTATQGGTHASSHEQHAYLQLLAAHCPVLACLARDPKRATQQQVALERLRSSLDWAMGSMLRPLVQETVGTTLIVIAVGWVCMIKAVLGAQAMPLFS